MPFGLSVSHFNLEPKGCPAQNGALALALHWHNAAGPDFSAVNFRSMMSLTAWEPLQNGWLLDLPHWHQK